MAGVDTNENNWRRNKIVLCLGRAVGRVTTYPIFARTCVQTIGEHKRHRHARHIELIIHNIVRGSSKTDRTRSIRAAFHAGPTRLPNCGRACSDDRSTNERAIARQGKDGQEGQVDRFETEFDTRKKRSDGSIRTVQSAIRLSK